MDGIAKRLMFVWTWIRGGSRYPFRFALDHPIRSAGIAYVATGEPGAPDALQVNRPVNEYLAPGMPPWLEGSIKVGDKVLPTRNISPVSTPWELAQTIADQPGAHTVMAIRRVRLRAFRHVRWLCPLRPRAPTNETSNVAGAGAEVELIACSRVVARRIAFLDPCLAQYRQLCHLNHEGRVCQPPRGW